MAKQNDINRIKWRERAFRGVTAAAEKLGEDQSWGNSRAASQLGSAYRSMMDKRKRAKTKEGQDALIEEEQYENKERRARKKGKEDAVKNTKKKLKNSSILNPDAFVKPLITEIQRESDNTTKKLAKNIQAAIKNPHSPLAKMNEKNSDMLFSLGLKVSKLQDDTQYLRKKIDKEFKKLNSIVAAGGGSGGKDPFNTNTLITGGVGALGTLGTAKLIVRSGGLLKVLGLGKYVPAALSKNKELAKFLSKLGKLSKAGGIIGIIAIIIGQAIEPLVAYLEGKPESEVKKEIVGAISGTVGTIVSAAAGAFAGGAVGAFFFGVGSVPGAILGAAGGLLAGYTGGEVSEDLAERLYMAIMYDKNIVQEIKKWKEEKERQDSEWKRKYMESLGKRATAQRNGKIISGMGADFMPDVFSNQTKSGVVVPKTRGGRPRWPHTPTPKRIGSVNKGYMFGPNLVKGVNKGVFYGPDMYDPYYNQAPYLPQIFSNQTPNGTIIPPRGTGKVIPPVRQNNIVPGKEITPPEPKTQGERTIMQKMFRLFGFGASFSSSGNTNTRRERNNDVFYGSRTRRYGEDAYGNLNPTAQGLRFNRIFNGVESAMGSYLVDQRWDQMPSMYGGRFAKGGVPGGGFSNGRGGMGGKGGNYGNGGTTSSGPVDPMTQVSPAAQRAIRDLTSGKTVSGSRELDRFSDAELEALGIQKIVTRSPENRGITSTSYRLGNPTIKSSDIARFMSGGMTTNKAGKVLTASNSGMTLDQRTLLSTLAIGNTGESGRGYWESPDYNTIVGGKKFDSYADHPRIFGTPESTAAGRYQFTKTTWDDVVKRYNKENPNNPITDFSPNNQDRAAWYLAEKDYKRRTNRNLTEDMQTMSPEQIAPLIKSGLGGFGKNTTWQILQKKSEGDIAQALKMNRNRESMSGSVAETLAGARGKYALARQRAMAEARSRQGEAIASILSQKGSIAGNTGQIASFENRVFQNQGSATVRKGALKNDLVEKLNYAANKNGVFMEVFSGGQRMEGARGHTGSHRHDDGGAADFRMYRLDKNGKKEYLYADNPEHQAIISSVTRDAAAAGVEGVGASYMFKNGQKGVIDHSKFHFGGRRSDSPHYRGKKDAPMAYTGPDWFKKVWAEGNAKYAGGFDFRTEMAQMAATTGKKGKAGVAATLGGLSSSFFNTMNSYDKAAQEMGIPTVTATTIAGYSDREYTQKAQEIYNKWVAGGKQGSIVVSGHSYGGVGAIRIAEKLKQNHGVKNGVTLNLVDPMAYNDFRTQLPDNVDQANVIYSSTGLNGFKGFDITASSPRTVINKTTAGADHVMTAFTPQTKNAIMDSLNNSASVNQPSVDARIQQLEQPKQTEKVVQKTIDDQPVTRATQKPEPKPSPLKVNQGQEPSPSTQQRYNATQKNTSVDFPKGPQGVENIPTWSKSSAI